MPASLVLFDIDGTLVDTASAGRQALERAFAAIFEVDGVSARAAGVEYAGRTDPLILADVARAIGVAERDYDARRDDLKRRFLDELASEMRRPEPRRRALPGVAKLLEVLDARENVWLGLLTGNLEAGARAKLEPFGLNRFFPDGGFSSDHHDRREIARIAREKLTARAGIPFPGQVRHRRRRHSPRRRLRESEPLPLDRRRHGLGLRKLDPGLDQVLGEDVALHGGTRGRPPAPRSASSSDAGVFS